MRIIFFDGVCHLCQASVKFIIARDAQAQFHFASLQSPLGQKLAGDITSVALYEDGKVYRASTAALRIAKRLKAPWPLAYAFIVVPRPLRDWVYALIASNRYKWFGKDEACWLPTPQLRARFVEDDPTLLSTVTLVR